MPHSRRSFVLGASGLALSAVAGRAAGAEKAPEPESGLIVAVESLHSRLHAIEIEGFPSFATTAELQALHRAIPGFRAKGSVIRCSLTITNMDQSSYLVAASAIEGMLLFRLGCSDDQGRSWPVVRTVDAHPDSISCDVPILARVTKRLHWTLWEADIGPSAASAAIAPATCFINYRIEPDSTLWARRMLDTGLGNVEDVPVRGWGRCLVTQTGE